MSDRTDPLARLLGNALVLATLLGMAFERGRKVSDSAIAAGLGDIGRTALGSVSASYNNGWFSARGSVFTDVGGQQQGTRAPLDLDARYTLLPSLVLSAGPGVTWADGAYTRTYFGVNAAQSAATACPPTTRALEQTRCGSTSVPWSGCLPRGA